MLLQSGLGLAKSIHLGIQLGLEIKDGFTHISDTSDGMAGRAGDWPGISLSLSPHGFSRRVPGPYMATQGSFTNHILSIKVRDKASLDSLWGEIHSTSWREKTVWPFLICHTYDKHKDERMSKIWFLPSVSSQTTYRHCGKGVSWTPTWKADSEM